MVQCARYVKYLKLFMPKVTFNAKQQRFFKIKMIIVRIAPVRNSLKKSTKVGRIVLSGEFSEIR